MTVITGENGWKYPRHKGAALVEKRAAMLAALRTVDARSPRATPRTLQRIAREYMFEDQGMVWPVWQALASNIETPARVIHDLEQKGLWYLDILLVQHPYASDAFIHRMKDLPANMRGAHSDYKGYDQNKELRAHAYKRLGLAIEKDDD